jgi:hypothetical protein
MVKLSENGLQGEAGYCYWENSQTTSFYNRVVGALGDSQLDPLQANCQTYHCLIAKIANQC